MTHNMHPVLRHPHPEVVALGSRADVVFLCLPNNRAAQVSPPSCALVVDLSGVHRLVDETPARRRYGAAPGAWSCGLPELNPAAGLSLTGQPGKREPFEPLLGPLRLARSDDVASLRAAAGREVGLTLLEPVLGEAA